MRKAARSYKLAMTKTRTLCWRSRRQYNWSVNVSLCILQDDDNDSVRLYLRDITKAYVQSTSDLNRDFYIRPPPELIVLLGASPDCIIKVMKSLYDVPKAGNHWFATYHPHYKEKLGMTEFTCDFCLYRSDPLGIVEMQTDDTLKQYVAQKARGAYIASVCQPEASFELSRAAQTVEFSPDDIALLNKRLQWQITNKSRELRYVKLDRDTLQLVVFTDSSFANNKDLSSQISYVIYLANATNKANIIHWSSIKCKRLTRIVLVAELYAIAHGFDIGAVIKATLGKIRKSASHSFYAINTTE